MAKGLRSKSKVAARRVKRTNPASIYKITAEQRIQKASDRLVALSKAPKISATSIQPLNNDDDADSDTNGDAAALMEQDGDDAAASSSTAAKVSTSGTRGSRRETWREARGWKARVGSKNNGKTKRRR
ncbi:hypothetical protein CF327_g5576 [Tilletia walkeri]|nr:hypothetical protein CF327_g5576 [Tilletia walkeri]